MNRTFKYLRPETYAEAHELKSCYGDKARYWAGGTDLLIKWKNNLDTFDYCIDLSFITDLTYIRKHADNLFIGSLTKVASLETSAKLEHPFSVIRDAAKELATPQIRNMATIGGNLCNASPCADLATPLIALDAQAKIMKTGGEHWVNMDRFFQHVNKTALGENDFLIEIKAPLPPAETACCFLKVGRTVIDIAIVNMASRITMDSHGIVSDARIAFGAVAPTPLRIVKAEKMLLGIHVSKVKKSLIDELALVVVNEIKPISDVRSTLEYRQAVSKTLTQRSIENTIQTLRSRLMP